MNKNKSIQMVLIVDDEIVVRNGISRALQKKGLQSKQAGNAQEALSILKHHPIDMALVDIHMPDMDGIELLNLIRVNHPKIQVIMITGYPTIDSAVHCTKMGALDYLVKPFRLDDLESALNKSGFKPDQDELPSVDKGGLKIDSKRDLFIGESPAMKAINPVSTV